jgi:hypothetical protein
MTFHQRTADVSRHNDGAEAALGQASTAGFDATKLQATGSELASLKGNSTVDSKVLPTLAFFDSQAPGEHGGSSPMLMAFGEGKGNVFGRIGDKVKEVGGKTVDGAKKVGDKTGELVKKSTGNDKPYSEKQLESAVEKALDKHDPATRKAIHDTIAKLSEADKHKLYADVQKYNTEVSLAKNGTKFGGIIGGGPIGGVLGSKSSEKVGKVVPEPDSLKNLKKHVNEKLRHH